MFKKFLPKIFKSDEKTLSLDLPSINAYITFAILLREKGEYYKSIKLLERLKEENLPKNEKKVVYLNLGLTYKSAGFLDRAEEVFQRGINLFPTEASFYYELAQIYKVSNKIEEAVSLLEKAVQLESSFREELLHTKLYLADYYIEKGRTDKAFRIIRKLDAVILPPLFYYVLSKLYYYIGEKEKGYKKALQGIKLSPKHIYPFLKVIEEFEDLSESKLRDIIKRTTLLPLTGLKLSEILISENRKEEAFKILRELNERFPLDPKVKESYLRLSWELGKRKLVVEEIEKLIKLLKNREKNFKCRNCGFRTDTFDWVCPKCKKWEGLEINCEI